MNTSLVQRVKRVLHAEHDGGKHPPHGRYGNDDHARGGHGLHAADSTRGGA